MPDLKYEQNLFNQGCRLIGGIDEAGRGPLAGPVVAACVLIKPDFEFKKEFEAIKNSKLIIAKKREEVFNIVKDNFEYGVGICDQATIDRINILEATFLAMKKAITALKNKPEFVFVDGSFKIPNTSINQQAVVKGDDLVFSVAAASIIAKVTRDRMMLALHEKYPEYGFDKHKGYGTALHLKALREHGPCEIHRRSFGPVKNLDDRPAI